MASESGISEGKVVIIQCMRLPLPNVEEVEEFRQLYLREVGVELSPDQAQELATKIVQLSYVKYYAAHPLCREAEVK